MNLQEIIKQRGLTNYKVAKIAGIGQATISCIVAGKRKEPKYSTAIKIAKVLEIKVDDVYEAIKEG